jgi:DNA polymerase-3 subunit gamma/tau
MSYTVLARKWRPQVFDDVKGQESVVATLSRALESGRVSHAYLFTGSRGIGKTTIARIMAKALCCEKGIGPRPCGECIACQEITRGNAVDVIEIDGASHTGVDDIRELREAVRFQPQRCRFKVFILDEVHMLSTSAFNALLKTLEEPPPHVKFIFATTEPHKIPVTILSRCQRYDFKRIHADVIVARLKEVLAAEGLSVAEDGLFVIARAAEGGMRDALSLTDQVLSFAGEHATAEQVTAALGLIDRRTVVDCVKSILARDTRSTLLAVDRVHDQGHDLRTFVEAIASELRHLAISRSAGTIDGFVDLAREDILVIDETARGFEPRDLQRLFQTALAGVDEVAESENPKLASELVALKLCARPPVADALLVNEALVRLDALVRGRPVPPLSPTHRQEREASGARATALVEETLAQGSRATSGVVPSPPRETPHVPGDAGSTTTTVLGAAVKPAPPPKAARADSPVSSSRPLDARETAPRVDEGREDPPQEDDVSGPIPVSPIVAAAVGEGTEIEVDDVDADDLDPALGLPLEGIDPRMKAFVDHVWTKNERLGAHLMHARLVGVDKAASGPLVKLSFERGLHERTTKDAIGDTIVKNAVVHAFGAGAVIDLVPHVEGAGQPPTLAEASKKALDDVEKALDAHARAHPVVKRAIELFGGEVRSVRRTG